VREVNLGVSTPNLIVVFGDVQITAALPSNTSATISLLHETRSPIVVENFPSLSVCIGGFVTFFPLRLILIELFAFDVPLTVMVFVETVVSATGSVIVTTAFSGGAVSLLMTVIGTVLVTPSPPFSPLSIS